MAEQEIKPTGRPRMKAEDRRSVNIQVAMTTKELQWMRDNSPRSMAAKFRSVIPASVRPGGRP